MNLSDIIQTLAVLAAVGASIVALHIARRDRTHASEIAAEDRRAAAQQAGLAIELEAAKRLAILEARGGHTDSAISKDMGAETLALIALLGENRVPAMWARRVGKTDEELRAYIEDDSEPEYLRDAVESERAVHDIFTELRALHSRVENG